MAFDDPSSPAQAEFDEIPEVPDSIPRDQWKRPLIVPAGGGRATAYTRASTLGKAIEDTYHLNLWMIRCVVIGMSRRPDLVALAAAVPSNEGEHRAPLDEIGKEAKTAGKGDEGANIGTALHKLSERRDAGEDLSYLPEYLMDAIQAYSIQMRSFKVLASETFVACDHVQTAGTFDRVVQSLVDLTFHHRTRGQVVIPAGTVLVLDLKTGKADSAKYWGPTYGVQQAVYQAGDPYLPSGRITWEDLLGPGLAPSDEWAVLLHVPSDSPKDSGLIIVDLQAGRAMADLCLEIRDARKSKALLSDAYPVEAVETADDVEDHVQVIEVAIPVQRTKVELIGKLRAAADDAALTALWEAHQDVWDDDATRMVRVRLAELGAAG